MSPTPSWRAAGEAPSVRLKIAYKTPESLLGEFTRSVGQGGVTLETKRSVPVGTRFIFELHAGGVSKPVEVTGRVVSVDAREGGDYVVTVRYDAGMDRAGLDAVLRQILESHQWEKLRRHPRIPLKVRAVAEDPLLPACMVKDISRGGVGMEVEAMTLPPQVHMGAAVLLEMEMELGPLLLPGEVVWTFGGMAEATPPLPPGFGVYFGTLRMDTLERLEQLLALEAMPKGPWRARVSFGEQALARMP